MKKTLVASLFGLVFAPSVYAAEDIELEDVVVTATRTAQLPKDITADITTIDREEIQRAGSDSLTDILGRQPGIQISTNGGAGTASNIYLRGTNSDQIVVLVDGLRINSVTLGTTAFESIPLSQIEKIEILRGPASSLYGADAIGGVIQIFTRKNNNARPHFYAASGIGSYDTKTAEAGISGGYKRLTYSLNVSSLDTDSFSARRERTSQFDSDDDGHRKLSFSANTELLVAEGHSLGLQYFESKNANEYDSGSDNFDNYSHQTLQSYGFTSKNRFTSFWHSTLKLGLGVDRSNSYDLPTAFSAPGGVSKYRSEQKQLTWQNDLNLPLGTLTLAYDRLEQKVDSSNNYDEDKRNTDAFLASYLFNHSNHSFQASLREDHNSQYGNFTTGGAGYVYNITPSWRVSTSYGKAFKAPTFNQLYFPNFGNPALEPEKSDNVDIAIKYDSTNLSGGITLFQNKIRNLIANTGPVAGTCTFAGFCPVNIGKVEIQGVTFNGRWDITENLLLNGHYTMQSPRDIATNQLLARRGNRYGAINLLQSIGKLQWGMELNGASTRYNDNDNSFKLDGYVLTNLTANYRFTTAWRLEARANNIFNKNYTLASTKSSFSPNGPDYNTAGSNLYVGLRYDMDQ